jgi:hypothetical protein
MPISSAQHISLKKISLILVLLLVTSISYSQSIHYNQFWNETQFNRTINKKWSAELDLEGTYSSTDYSSNLFDKNIQRAIRGWAHYYLTPRWKLSTSLAYHNNKDVPEIGQFESPEWRFTTQGTYFFHKTGYTLSTRMRLEFRHLKNQEDDYENVLRYRQQIKYMQPLNSKILRQGVVYAVASDEVYIKTQAEVTGESFFDRNRFNIGAGYLFTDDIQVELTYANEYLPRSTQNKIINAASLNVTFNNLFKKLHKKLFQKPETQTED